MNTPAFPIPIAGCNDGGVYNTLQQSGGQNGGLTKRELFAAMALQGMLADESGGEGSSYGPVACAERAVIFADALLAALSDETKAQS